MNEARAEKGANGLLVHLKKLQRTFNPSLKQRMGGVGEGAVLSHKGNMALGKLKRGLGGSIEKEVVLHRRKFEGLKN